MNVDRLSVTVPAALGEELRRVANLRGEPVSALVTEAISRELRLIALDEALRHADTQFGPVSEEEVLRAMQSLLSNAKVA